MAAVNVEVEAAAAPLIVDAAGMPAASQHSSDHASLSTPIDSALDSEPQSVFEQNESTGPASGPNMPPGDNPTVDNNAAVVETAAGVAADLDAKPEAGPEAAEPEKQSGNTVSYHQNADIFIRVGESAGTAQHYKVSFAVVAAASPTLINVLNAQKPMVSRSGKLVYDLADLGTESHGLDIVLSVIHYKFHEIPSRPDVDLLCSIARVVEKFNCAHLLVPFMEKWVAGLDWHIVMKKEQNDDDKTLFLTWVFGEARWFAHMLSRVAHKATLDGSGNLLDAHGQPWKDQNLPPAILELIIMTRYDCLTKIVRAVDEPLRELMDGNKDALKFCRSKDTIELKLSCQHQQLGSLVSSLSSVGLLPFPSADEYRGSVAALAEKVRAINVVRFKLPGTPPHMDSHINCGINHREAVDKTMGEAAELTSEITEQLKLRAQKSGVSTLESLKEVKNEEGQPTTPGFSLEDLRRDGVHFKQVTDDSVSELGVEIKTEDVEA